MLKHLIVGEAPNRRGHHLTLVGLGRLLGISSIEASEAFDRMNVFPYWLGSSTSGKGDWWDPVESAKIVEILRSRGFFGSPDYPRKRVILMGKRVARAFGLEKLEYFDRIAVIDEPHRSATEHVVVPHFSGVNRWWNDESNRTLARKKWKKWLKEAQKDA